MKDMAAVMFRMAGVDPAKGSAAATGKPAAGAPYADGTPLKGKDGKNYVVRNGVPVLDSRAKSGLIDR
jgi:hypothetical protein